jgi:NAD(P)-dependent dehydrogenase (short-subunit alcohol dehydrogenase family)
MERNYPFSLAKKLILVTGASSGIGKSIAIECSKMGGTIIITGRDSNRLEETYSLLCGTGHQRIIADLANSEEIDNLVSQLPAIDGLVLNAGINPKSLVKFIKHDILEEVFSTNVFSPILLVQSLVKKKKINKAASIVFMSSISTSYASVSNSVYSASKGAINSFMKVLALELAPQKTRVNAIQPGMVRTRMMEAYAIQEELEAWEKSYPLGRFGEPEDIANACVYLLSEAAAWVTGTILTVDGGITLR